MNLVVYQFSRSRVERGDFSHFLDIYAPEKLPQGRRLRKMMNSMAFMIEGFDDGPREIRSSPEVRGHSTRRFARHGLAVEYDRGELMEFLRANFPPMNALCERGGMFEQLIYERTRAIFAYFKLRFDAPPPK